MTKKKTADKRVYAPPTDREVIAASLKRIQNGERPRDIADELGIARQRVHQWVHSAKVRGDFATPTGANKSNVHEAILYLRSAKRAMMRETNGKDLSESQLLVLLALKALEGRT